MGNENREPFWGHHFFRNVILVQFPHIFYSHKNPPYILIIPTSFGTKKGFDNTDRIIALTNNGLQC